MGQTYTAACGSPLPNLGEQILDIATEEGMEAKVKFQMAEVTRPLCSVSKICDRGHRVVFELGGGCIENLKTGWRIEFARRDNVYILNWWVYDDGSAACPDFGRQRA